MNYPKKRMIAIALGTLVLGVFGCQNANRMEFAETAADGYFMEEEIYLEPNESGGEQYDVITENDFKLAQQNPLSTFSIDVDNASYSNVRRFITSGQLPPKDAVRIEEMINYFDYGYEGPGTRSAHPFKLNTEVTACPWNPSNKLVRIGIQGERPEKSTLAPSNLVFLIDASGSMSDRNKLPLLKRSFKLLLDELSPEDRVAIVTYAGSAGLVLESTPVSEKRKILSALDNIGAGGSTSGGQGIALGYQVATENLKEDGNNRVILCTDGDFNVGTNSPGELIDLIRGYSQKDIYLTICGLGMGNYKDGSMESISNAGNGNYFYIDNIDEARKVFVDEITANLYTIAKDVKIQVEFNPAHVKAYRLIGYANRMLESEDFNNDLKDAGELGAGHNVTALYEVVPVGSDEPLASIDDLKYQAMQLVSGANSQELMTLKLRYKPPTADESILIEEVITNSNSTLIESSHSTRFAAAVAAFGMVLRDSPHKKTFTYRDVEVLASSTAGEYPSKAKEEFLELINLASRIER